jgi:hypothetical protein
MSQSQIDFSSLPFKVPDSVKLYSPEDQMEMYKYLSEMGELERKAYEIALDHLGPSFNVYRSTGYIAWKKNKN